MASISEFARLVGVNEGVIRRAIKRGRVVVSPDGGIDEATQVERWHAMRDASKVRGNGEKGRPVTTSTAKASRGALRTVELRDGKLEAEIALLNQRIALMARENVSRASVRRALSAHSRTMRTMIDNFAGRYAQEIAGEVGAEPKALVISLDLRIRQLLAELHEARSPGEFAHE
uniref:Elements of external origin n=1 Tax=Bosea sp. NBC_00436 TaxID=2969620 RepID=A0A9E8A006_9HYPH